MADRKIPMMALPIPLQNSGVVRTWKKVTAVLKYSTMYWPAEAMVARSVAHKKFTLCANASLSEDQTRLSASPLRKIATRNCPASASFGFAISTNSRNCGVMDASAAANGLPTSSNP